MKRRFEWPAVAVRFVLVIALAVGVVSAAQLAVSPRVTPASAGVTTGTSGVFVPAEGTVLDTRSGVGGVSGPVTAYTWYPVQVAGLAGVPTSGLSSVQVSATVLNPAVTGYLKLAANDTATVATSALLYTGGGGSFSASSIVALATDGKIRVLAQQSVNVLISVQGYYSGGTGDPVPGGYVPVPPRRLVDTRNGTGLPQAKLAVGSMTGITVGGLAGVPADASAAFLMLTAISSSSTTGGSFTAYPTGTAKPANVALSYLPNTATILGAPVDLGTGGRFNLAVGSTGGAIDVVVDIVGYYTASAVTGGAFTPASVRIYDSRIAPAVELAGGETRKLPIGGVAGVPLPGTGISAYAINLQVLHTGPNIGFVAVGPGDKTNAFISSLYLTPGDTYRSNLVIAQPGPDGTIQVFNIVLDVEGWYSVLTPPVPLISSEQYPEDMTVAAGPGDAGFHVSADMNPLATVARFEWSLDGGSVSSVMAYRDDDLLLANFTPSGALTSALGPHTLRVTSIDQQGHRSAASSYAWTIGDPGDLGQPPATQTVTSATYAEDRWSPLTETADFDISAANQNPLVTALTYALDDAADTSLAGDTVHLSLSSPTTTGVHVLHVSATNTQGYSTYDYAFYLGDTPDAVASVAITPGQSSALISWTPATVSGGTVTGYDLQLVNAGG